MCHNGEINTLRGNKNWMHARGGLLHSEYFGDETANLLPVCSDNMSDSGNFDSVLELSVKAGDREIPEVCVLVGCLFCACFVLPEGESKTFGDGSGARFPRRPLLFKRRWV